MLVTLVPLAAAQTPDRMRRKLKVDAPARRLPNGQPAPSPTPMVVPSNPPAARPVGAAPPPPPPAAAPPTAPAAPPAAPAAPPGGTSAALPAPGQPASAISPLPGEKEATQECKKYPPGKRFKWELRGEVDLMTMLNAVSPMMCRPFVVPGNVRQAKVTIIAPDTMTAPEAYRMFLSALETMGLTVQPQGRVLKIIDSNRAKESAIPIYKSDGSDPPSQDQYVTRLLRLEYVSTEEIVAVISKLKSKDADIIPYPPTNTLIITDLGSNIARLEQVIHQLDVPMGGERIWVIKLRTMLASEMATLLQQIFGVAKAGTAPAAGAKKPGSTLQQPAAGATAAGRPNSKNPSESLSISQIIPDDKNNVLIIVSTEKAYQRILGLIKRLEPQYGAGTDSVNERVHVVPIENAIADEVATTLGNLGAGVGRSGAAAGGRPGAPAPAAGAGAHQTTPLFEGEVRIAADKPTNSLVIVASPRDFYTVRDLIKRLDMVRRQVFVEAAILEVSIDKSRKLGVSYHGGTTVGSGDQQSLILGGMVPDGISPSSFNSVLLNPAVLSGLGAAVRGPTIPNSQTLFGASIPAFGVILQALQTNGDTNIISMPHLLTTDNEKATIEVGQNLPFPGSLGGFPGFGGVPGAGGAGGASFGFGTSVQRQNVSLKLEITPHVNDSDFVRLELDTNISDVANPNFNGLGPSTSTRSVKSTVTVRDQQSIVLGGLIRDRLSETVNKVPLLGDIPILGYLFKKTDKTVLKQNLLIVLTPYIIKDPSDLRRIMERKLRERKDFLERYSVFKDERDYEAEVDFRRKRGLLEEINRTAREVEVQASELRNAEARLKAREIEGEVVPVPSRHPSSAPEGPPPPPVFIELNKGAKPPSPGPTPPPPPAPEPRP